MKSEHLVIIFRTRLRPEVTLNPELAADLEQLGGRMYELASAMPGFMSYKDFEASDGESISIIEFDNAVNLAAWRNQPEHLAAQREGKERFFESYQIQVANVERQYSFNT